MPTRPLENVMHDMTWELITRLWLLLVLISQRLPALHLGLLNHKCTAYVGMCPVLHPNSNYYWCSIKVIALFEAQSPPIFLRGAHDNNSCQRSHCTRAEVLFLLYIFTWICMIKTTLFAFNYKKRRFERHFLTCSLIEVSPTKSSTDIWTREWFLHSLLLL